MEIIIPGEKMRQAKELFEDCVFIVNSPYVTFVCKLTDVTQDRAPRPLMDNDTEKTIVTLEVLVDS